MSEPSATASHVRSVVATAAIASAPPSPVALLFLRGRDADGRILHLVAERRALRLALGTLALPLVKRRGYEGLGFRALGDHARERLGVTAQVVRDWARVTEALAALPRRWERSLRRSWRRRPQTTERFRLEPGECLRRAMRRLQRIDHDLGHILHQMIDRRLHLELGFVSFERYVEERVDVSPRTARRWVRMARLGPLGGAVARALRAGSLSPKQADIVLQAVPPAKQAEAVAFAQGVTLRRLEDEQSGAGDGAVSFTAPPEAANVFWLALEAARRHLRVGTSEALLWMLDQALEAWAAQGAQFDDYADFQRDRFRCTAPGCTARRNLQSHHIVFRSHGGPDEAWNCTTLCAFHHLRGIHARTLSCRGRAPEELVFELGLRAQGGALLRVGAGDVILGAAAP